MNIIEQGTRQKLRFNYKGIVTIEDLFDIPLTKLDIMHGELKKIITLTSEESLLNNKSFETKETELKIAIIKHVVVTRQEENKLKLDKQTRIERNEKIKGIIASKKDKHLEGLDVKDLESMLETE